jgi:FtsP/CotA-like multicopper oxidase with cupredoxin domain
MNWNNKITRRDFLKYSAAGSALLLAATGGRRPQNLYSDNAVTIPEHKEDGIDLDLILRAEFDELPLLPGHKTKVLRYSARVIHGDADAVRYIEGSYLGPVITVRRGQRIRVQFQNGIHEKSIVHWHGLHVPEMMDGQPRYAVEAGSMYSYEFTVTNRAGTYWYHPHPHRTTGPQVYFGLAGLFVVADDEALDQALPHGEHDIPLVIQDRSFDSNNQLLYLTGGMMDRMTGFHGDRILVNGKSDQEMTVSPVPHRLRILNGSNARIYKLAWDDGTPVTLIGTDGGLIEEASNYPYLMVAPGERVELWIDFGSLEKGTARTLQSLPFQDSFFSNNMGRMHHGRGMMEREAGTGTMFYNETINIMSFRTVTNRDGFETPPIKLSSIETKDISDAVNRKKPRHFNFSMRGMAPLINNRMYEPGVVSPLEVVKLGTTEVWELSNGSSGMMGMMQMPHPVHIHGLQFRIVDRDIDRDYRDIWETVREGWVDSGLKDTLLLMPGMRVKLLMSFDDYPGMFLYHCHNLEHEDAGMMRNYLIQA